MPNLFTLPGPRVGPDNVFAGELLAPGSHRVVASNESLYASLALVFWSNHNVVDFTNHGTVWTISNDNVAGGVAGFYIDHLTNTGLMVAEARNGNAEAMSVGGSGSSVFNSGSVYAIANGNATGLTHFGPWVVVRNSGLIAAYSPSASTGGHGGAGGAVGIAMYNAGTLINEAGGSILAEGIYAQGVIMGGGGAYLDNAGRIEALSLTPGQPSYGIGAGGSAHMTNRFFNSGVVKADIVWTSFFDHPAYGTHSVDLIENRAGGQLIGDIRTGHGADVFVNRGSIIGDLELGEQADLFDSSEGLFTGAADLGWHDDRFVGGPGTDLAIGNRGEDQLFGGGGEDLLLGGVAADEIVGGAGNDGLYGEYGNDLIVTSAGDAAYGGDGDDLIVAGDLAFDLISGGNGIDTVRIDTGPLNLDLGAAIATGRLQSIERIELQADQGIAIRGGDASALGGGTLDVIGIGSSSVTLVGGWSEGLQVLRQGETFRSFALGGETIYVRADLTVTVAASAGPGLTGLDAVAGGAAAPVAGSLPGSDLSNPVIELPWYHLKETLVVEVEETLWAVEATVIVGAASDATVINHGTITTSGAGDYVYYAIGENYFDKLVNYGTVRSTATANAGAAGYGPGTDGKLENWGLIEAIADAGPATAAAARARLEPGIFVNHGTILARSSTGVAIGADIWYSLSQTEEMANNDGLIHAIGGARTVGFNFRTSGLLVNDGTIRAENSAASGAQDALGILLFNFGEQASRVDNRGTIEGVVAIRSDGGAAEIANSGLIQGDILLNDRDDRVTNSGRIFGQIDLGAGNDSYLGAAAQAAARVKGGDGNDELVGGSHGDEIKGGAGSDRITGGRGGDDLDGGAGADIFIYRSSLDSTSGGTDRIRNFESQVDSIDLRGIAGASVSWVELTDPADNSLYSLVTVNARQGTMTIRVDARITTISDFLMPAPSITGTGGNDDLVGTADIDDMLGFAGNDRLEGREGDDWLTGADGDDRLIGGAGSDTMIGGAGNDLFVVDDAGDTVEEAGGGGVDLIESSISFALAAEIENLILTGSAAIDGTGNALANAMQGNDAANRLDGGEGNDRLVGGLGADQLIGGLGDDVFVFDTVDSIVEDADGGTDTVESDFAFTLPANVENLILTGGAAVDGTGNALANAITGNGAANRLDGGTGADVMRGLGGADTYVVDDAGDTTLELAGGGIDTVESSVSLTIGDEIERLTLTGTADLNGTGNGLANILTGNGGNNVLDGGLGSDLMVGGLGDDTYVVDVAGDQASEQNGAGTDTVRSTVSYTLGDSVENLVLLAGALNGTGNGLANSITGNDSANLLDGNGGSDNMAGGLGDDVYMVDDAGDLVTEAAGAGTDSIHSTLSLTLGNNVENLVLLAGTLTGTGNALANSLTGNGGNNTLNGLAGADAMAGGAGHDTYIVDNAGDVVTEGLNGGNDTVLASTTYTLGDNIEYLTLTGTGAISGTGNALNNIINGNASANFLNGGLGADFMTGNGGDDTYFVDNASDKVTEAAGGGTDTVNSSVNWTLGAETERLVLTGTASLTGIGNDLANIITGNAAANILNGGIGADTMQGGLGNDTYVVDNAGDVTRDTGGVDTVQSSVTIALHASIDNLVLTGTAAINGTGNALWNVMTGNGAANTLDGGLGNDVLNGGLGADTMIGGAGHDTYHVDNAGDQVIDTGGGNDHVHSSIDYVLGADFEYLTLTGSAVSATGNAKNNLLYGNAGNNVIDGGLGADFMVGGKGNDTYYVENGSDQITEHLNQGTDTVMSLVHHALRANIENLTLIGTNAVSATGNELNNVITGNSAANTLRGGLGADTLSGGGGNDSFVYRATNESTSAAKDQITGFNAGDKINLSVIDAVSATTGNNDAFTFIGANAFSNTAGELRATESGGVWTIEADVNGDGLADLVIGLTTDGAYVIGAADFIL